MQITPSSEITAIIRRWGRAVAARDEETLRNLLSTSDHLSYLGSAEGELWTGKLIRDGIGEHFRELPEWEEKEERLEAFECGPVGWAYDMTALRFAGSDRFVMHRVTFILVLEHGAWKIAHMHVSNPTPNIEKMGVESTALNALVAAARAEFRMVGRAGMASVMFTDVVDSAALADAMGDRLWSARIDSHLATVRSIVEAAGGTLVKSLGDGTMSTFTSARACLEAARNIQRASRDDPAEPVLRLRIGIHTGEVIENKGDFFGTVVNKAARVAGTAGGGEIRVSDATRIMVGNAPEFAFEDIGRVPLKGLEGDHVIYLLQAD